MQPLGEYFQFFPPIMKDENFIIDLCGLNLVSFAAFYYRFSFLDYISNVFTVITNVIFEALKCKSKWQISHKKNKL